MNENERVKEKSQRGKEEHNTNWRDENTGSSVHRTEIEACG